MELVAFAVESAAPQPGDPIGLTLWFRAWRSMAEPLSVYVHLLPTDPPTGGPGVPGRSRASGLLAASALDPPAGFAATSTR